MAILAWARSRHVFLKIQEGIGDNLSEEDIANGMTDYVLWNMFRPDGIDIDGTLDMNLIDSGMMMFKSEVSAVEALPECYAAAFNRAHDAEDVIVLLEEKDGCVAHPRRQGERQ